MKDEIQFTKDLETGNQRIDEQHKELINQLNKLHNAMKERRGREETANIISFLENYVVKHFADEEIITSKVVNSIQLTNVRAHKEFIAKVAQFKEEHQKNSITLTINMYTELSSWLINHIKTIDVKLVPLAKGA